MNTPFQQSHGNEDTFGGHAWRTVMRRRFYWHGE